VRRFIILAALSAPLAALPAPAQYRARRAAAPGDGFALIDIWLRHFLRRPANALNVPGGQMLDAGIVRPEVVLALILGSDEYYERTGDDARFIRGLFTDLTGRRPTRREARYWGNRLLHSEEGHEGRTQVAAEMIQRYPQQMSVAPPARAYDYRRPYYGPRRWRERDRYRDRR
jgi:hypothetical protein